MSQSLSQMVVSALREVDTPAPINVHFVRGDGRYITKTTTITMPDGSAAWLCGLTYEEQQKIIAINKRGGGRWLRDGSFQIFKNDLV